WDIKSISGGPTARIDFQDTRSLICANCHTTLNHVAPLFAFFDENGAYTPGQIAVPTPLPMSPAAVMTDWLPAGQPLAWRFGKPQPRRPAAGQGPRAGPRRVALRGRPRVELGDVARRHRQRPRLRSAAGDAAARRRLRRERHAPQARHPQRLHVRRLREVL